MKPQTFRRRINRSDLPDKARHVAHVMATDADFQTGAVTITLNQIQASTGIKSKTTVKKAVDDLVALGWLLRFPSGSRRKATHYRLDAPGVVHSLDHSDDETDPDQPVDNSPDSESKPETSGPLTGPLSGPVPSVPSGPLSGPLYGRELSSPTPEPNPPCAQPPAATADIATVTQLANHLGNRLANWDR